MSYLVVINAGLFDYILYEAKTKKLAKLYRKQLQKVCSLKLTIIPVENARKLAETFIDVEICTGVSVYV